MNRSIPVLVLFVLFTGDALAAGDKADSSSSGYIEWQANDYSIDEPLGGLKGDPLAGMKLAVERKKGNCIACHRLPVTDVEFPGNLGPPLIGLASRLAEGDIRLRVVDIKLLNPQSIMPGYYRKPELLTNVKKKFRGKTVLSAQEVEDIVAWLVTLR